MNLATAGKSRFPESRVVCPCFAILSGERAKGGSSGFPKGWNVSSGGTHAKRSRLFAAKDRAREVSILRFLDGRRFIELNNG